MKRRLLLVEDDLLLSEIIQKNLKSIGYDVTLAENGIEAVEMATSQLPDLIIMDIGMPKMDGLEATSRIRKNPKTQAIPILAATAMDEPGDREKCLAAGCDSYIAKPFTFKELRVAIETLLEKQSM
ncbi:MAG: response regulator [Deltaproteobacteria bacterium]|nr:response regulator [Deltaproteobacteria bacterium]